MGRFGHANAVVMPDRKTAYMSDDGTGMVLVKVTADVAGDLYAAKMTQRGPSVADPATTALEDHLPGESNYFTDTDVAVWAAGGADRVAFLESR